MERTIHGISHTDFISLCGTLLKVVVFHLSLYLITFDGHLAHLTYHVHKGDHMVAIFTF